MTETRPNARVENPFVEIHSKLASKIRDAKNAYRTVREIEGSYGKSPKELIAAQSRLRTDIQMTSDLIYLS